jgi:hypothetical protein
MRGHSGAGQVQVVINAVAQQLHDSQFPVQEEHEGTQWGRPGPGGAYWRNSAVTGQGFFDKMVSVQRRGIIL